MRKEAGLELTDRISLSLPADDADLLAHEDWIARRDARRGRRRRRRRRAGDREGVGPGLPGPGDPQGRPYA